MMIFRDECVGFVPIRRIVIDILCILCSKSFIIIISLKICLISIFRFYLLVVCTGCHQAASCTTTIRMTIQKRKKKK